VVTYVSWIFTRQVYRTSSSKNIMGSLLRMVYGNPSMTVITWKLQVQKKYSKSLVSVFVVKKKGYMLRIVYFTIRNNNN
jgi:hypothetical protein